MLTDTFNYYWGLYVYGGTITGNSSDGEGGGVLVNSDALGMHIKGSPVIKGNKVTDVFLKGSTHLTLDGMLENGCSIGVSSEKGMGHAITTFYKQYHGTSDPSAFFFSNYGYSVKFSILAGEEAAFAVPDMIADSGNTFINWRDQIKTDSVTAANWMSGISGERRINEINIPATHDSGMKSVKKRWGGSSVGSLVGGWDNAIAQRRYIDEQLDEGVRFLDLRLNHQYEVDKTFSYEWKDDGENLWICHGEDSIGGTYWAKDHDGNLLNLDTILT